MRAYQLFDQWLNAARPQEFEILELYIPLRPQTKERPRGEHRTPIKTRQWTDYFGGCVAELMEGRPAINFPVKTRVIFGYHKSRADFDNLEKALWDGMQRGDKSGRGRAIWDDKYIRRYAEKVEHWLPPGDEEFIWVRFYAVNTQDQINYEEQCNVIKTNGNTY